MKTKDYNTEELEAKLLGRFGQETPFTVPEDYFNNLEGRVMARVAQRNHRGIAWRWAVAAVLAGCVVTAGLFFENSYNMQISEAEDIQYIEDALNYSMIDNTSIESYLTEAE